MPVVEMCDEVFHFTCNITGNSRQCRLIDFMYYRNVLLLFYLYHNKLYQSVIALARRN
jgi:hypothetical protein